MNQEKLQKVSDFDAWLHLPSTISLRLTFWAGQYWKEAERHMNRASLVKWSHQPTVEKAYPNL